MKTLAFYNLKGGVGKTTTAVNFAYFAAKEGERVLLWDLDAQGGASFHFQFSASSVSNPPDSDQKPIERLIKTTNYANVDLIPANFKIRNLDVVLKNLKKGTRILSKMIQSVAHRYDYLFFDCPASISLLAQSIFRTADYLIIPVIPTTLAVQTFSRIQRYLFKQSSEQIATIIPFFSMVDFRKNLHREIMETHGIQNGFCQSYVSTRSQVEKMGHYHAPLPDYDQDSKSYDEVKALWEEIKTRMT